MTRFSVTLWQVGAGLRCVPRAQRRYVIARRRGEANAWVVWRETNAGRAELVDGHVSMELDAASTASTASNEPDAEAERADVLRLGVPGAALVDRTLARYPGCLVAVAPEAAGGCVAGARDGTRVVAAPVGPAGPSRPMTGDERAGFASFLHAQSVLGEPWTPASGCVVHAVQASRERAPVWVRVLALTPA